MNGKLRFFRAYTIAEILYSTNKLLYPCPIGPEQHSGLRRSEVDVGFAYAVDLSQFLLDPGSASRTVHPGDGHGQADRRI